MADHVGISERLCMVQGNVKYTSLESGQTSWKTGNLELATMPTGQLVCLVNFKIGHSRKFVLTNQIKGVIFNHRVPRCVVSLTSGTNISWTGKGHDRKQLNSPAEVQQFSHIIEDLKNGRKKDGRPNTSAQFGLHMSPQGIAHTPIKQSSIQRNFQSSHRQNTTPKSQASGRGSGGTSPNPMMTPSHLRAGLGRSPSQPAGEVFEIEEDSGTGSDEARTELSPLLFTDLQSDTEKENRGAKNGSLSARTPKAKGSSRGKSVYEMRQEEGRSLFMSSFQEKQLQLEERKENMAPRPNSRIKSFYSRGHQASGYAATDGFLPSRQTNSCASHRRTPGFLSLSQPKRTCLSTNYAGWNQRNVVPSNKTSQMSLQGFSNLGNTCYMNAILQSLFALETFTMDILNGDLSHMQEDSLYKALASLLFGKQRNQSADRIGMQLRRVKQAVSTTAARFSGFMQHDAQEFLCQCLDQLKEDWGSAQQRAQDASPGDGGARGDGPQDPKPSRRCPVVGNFEFEVLHSIACKQCGEVVTKAEQFYDLSLDMPRRSASNPVGSIQTALEQFFQAEAIEYACSECDCKQATVTHTFTRLPRVIIVHIKRYRFDTDAALNAKLRRRILIPKFLTLHYHCGKETQSPSSSSSPGPASLISRASGPLRRLNGETLQRTSVTDMTGRNAPMMSQSGKPLLFNPSTRKKLEYIDSNTSHQDRRSTIFLQDLPDKPSSLKEDDETQQALAMSKREAERATLEVEQRQQLEEEELKRAMEQSKQDVDRSLPVMSEEQQLAYALAISTQDASALRPRSPATLPRQTAPEMIPKPGGLGGLLNDASLPSVVKDGEAREVPTAGPPKRRTDDISSSVEGIHLQGSGDAVSSETDGQITPWKRFKPDGQASNQSTPSEQASCAGDSGVDLMDDSRNLESRTSSHTGQGMRKSTMDAFTQSPRNGAVDSQANDHAVTPHLRRKSALVAAAAIDIHRDLDHDTLPAGESNDKPSYEELKAQEDEQLRRATELSLQDAQEMALKEEDALKRAKEISLQEFSGSWHNPREDEEDADAMDVDDDTDEEVMTELNKNAESGHLPSSYRLVSVVSHIGSTSSVGHYISDVCDGKKTAAAAAAAWLSYDDSEVGRISESAVRENRERTGYIFFYVAQ